MLNNQRVSNLPMYLVMIVLAGVPALADSANFAQIPFIFRTLALDRTIPTNSPFLYLNFRNVQAYVSALTTKTIHVNCLFSVILPLCLYENAS